MQRLLILSYSFSSQTRNLIQGFVEGLEESGVEVKWHQLKTVERLQFPVGSYTITFAMMIASFFRKRVDIEPVDVTLFKNQDLVVLAGPTWSYSPSGPILKFIDSYKNEIQGHRILPFISCRSYWRVHYAGLKSLLKGTGASVLAPIVFSHPVSEPWSTLGVFFKMAGKVPESSKLLKKYYPKYGHTREQIDAAHLIGFEVGESLHKEESLRNWKPVIK
jgi:hypothetical protein